MLLELLNDAFPENVKLPCSYYKANKIISHMEFTYKTWDACPHHYMLFRNGSAKIDICEICGTSRYKQLGDPTGVGKYMHNK